MAIEKTSYAYISGNILIIVSGVGIVYFSDELVSEIWFASIIPNRVVTIGASLIAIGLAGVVLGGYLYFVSLSNEVVGVVSNIDFEYTTNPPSRNDLTSLRANEIGEKLHEAEESIDIIAISATRLFVDFGEILVERSRELNIRILLLDPDYPEEGMSFADQLDLVNSELVDTSRRIEDAIDRIEEHHKNPDLSFAVRLYRAFPTIEFIKIDDELIWSFHSPESSTRVRQYVANEGGDLYSHLSNHFNHIWENENLSKSVDR